MFHVKRILFVLIVSLISLRTTHLQAQGTIRFNSKPFTLTLEKDAELEQWLKQYPTYSAASKEEKEVLYYVNLVRKDPKGFYDKAISPFLSQYPEIASNYTRSLKADLYASAPLNLLVPTPLLHITAQSHAND